MPKELTLPSGRIAKIEDGKGRHLYDAQRKSKNTDDIPYALVAELTEIDGKKLPYEDILELPLADVSRLLTEINATGESVTAEQS